MKPHMSVVTVVLLILASTGIALAQTSVPKDKIPSGIAPDVLKEIEQLYASDSEKVAIAALNLGQLGERAAPAIPFLIGLLHDDSNMVGIDRERLKTLRWEGFVLASKDKVYVPGLQTICAGEALARIGTKAIQPLLLALKDKNPSVVGGAAFALSIMRDPAATRALLAALRGDNPVIRAKVARSLHYTKDPAVVTALIDALKDNDPDVRESAAASLADTKDQRAVEALINALADADSKVQDSAKNALEELTGQKLGKDPAKWRAWSEKREKP